MEQKHLSAEAGLLALEFLCKVVFIVDPAHQIWCQVLLGQASALLSVWTMVL